MKSKACYGKLGAWGLMLVWHLASAHSEPVVLPVNIPASSVPERNIHHIDTLNIHDPAILADPVSKKYYVYDSFHYGHPQENLDAPNKRAGVEAYWSDDLISWHGPKLIYDIEPDSWAQSEHAPWAPEVAYYQDKYYLFLTFHHYHNILEVQDGRPPMVTRGSQILVGDSPLGPFKRFSNQSHTPANEMALDGTLWIEDGQPWMIYCQEWIQTGAGLFKAIRLTSDLSGTIGQPITLFSAADADWTARTTRFDGKDIEAVVSDGPWPYMSKTGQLMLLWSSWNKDKTKAYTTSIAFSDNGKLSGNWTQRNEPLISGDRGHGNIFTTFDGQLMMALHRYFKQPHTRLQIFNMEDMGNDLQMSKQVLGHP
ncbi:glycoside hydrolase family 43 protein [Flavobacterium sp. W21_SRS_FM6]|uniref:glycoside hydrolase family 43 protein n=1 Tax=Flavobacterium sp. W21_SRS_FM6 TaxID=3240268 RepID=UPI003F90E1A7